jgi:Ca2+-binding EF-hand superfamily protein
MVEEKEFVDFDTIRTLIEISDENLFETYLKELYKDLVDRAESSKKQGIGKITFYDYMKMQIFISEKLFAALDKDGDGYLSAKEFVEGLMSLYFGNFNDTAKVIFNIFDFDKDGLINKGDIKITLSYLPLKESSHKDQMESLTEIEEILNLYFKKNTTLNFEGFIDAVKNIKSDIYLQLLCFIYENKPFNKENVEAYKYFKKKGEKSPSPKKTGSPTSTKRESVLLSSPSRKSKLLPASTFLGINPENFNFQNLEKHSKKGFKDEFNVEKLDDFVRLPNTSDKEGSTVLDSPSVFLKKLSLNTNKGGAFSISLNDMGGDKKNNLNQYTGISPQKTISDNNNVSPNRRKTKDTFCFSDYIYKITENNNLKKYYLSIVGKDIYYYKTEKKEELQGMHNMTGCFVKEKDEKVIEGNKLYGFSIIFSNKTRSYYTSSKKSLETWMSALRQSIGYQHFSDFYEMKGDLGEGKFGLVKLGIHKKTNEKVAIKIIKKDAMDNKDLELVRSEIDIMKLCRHENVVRLLDHFENSEFIFIVMEYLAGGDLSDYFKKKNYNFSESEAALVISQICNGIEYLHKYGVVHRDLKPENMMMAKKDNLSLIKIMDFGLSKIMGPQEKAADGFGTLSFVAPEVLIRKPYNKEVDVWSIGVTLYYMLTGTLPFDDDDDNEELIAKKIVFSKLQFYDKKWKKISDLCHDFIDKCLIKEPEKRETTTELLKHPWILKYCAK